MSRKILPHPAFFVPSQSRGYSLRSSVKSSRPVPPFRQSCNPSFRLQPHTGSRWVMNLLRTWPLFLEKLLSRRTKKERRATRRPSPSKAVYLIPPLRLRSQRPVVRRTNGESMQILRTRQFFKVIGTPGPSDSFFRAEGERGQIMRLYPWRSKHDRR